MTSYTRHYYEYTRAICTEESKSTHLASAYCSIGVCTTSHSVALCVDVIVWLGFPSCIASCERTNMFPVERICKRNWARNSIHPATHTHTQSSDARAKRRMEKWTVRITHKYVYSLLSFEVNASRISFSRFILLLYIILALGLGAALPTKRRVPTKIAKRKCIM